MSCRVNSSFDISISFSKALFFNLSIFALRYISILDALLDCSRVCICVFVKVSRNFARLNASFLYRPPMFARVDDRDEHSFSVTFDAGKRTLDLILLPNKTLFRRFAREFHDAGGPVKFIAGVLKKEVLVSVIPIDKRSPLN